MQSDLEKLRGTETVLVVEDEEALRCLVVDLLTHLGYRLLAASSGKEALSLAQRSGNIDLLVTDVEMPEMTGLELAAKVLESRPNLKVIFISGYAGGGVTVVESFKPEAVMVHKPFSIKTLAAKIRKLLDA
jgi:two-component system cell cycle sensor histidine kinase/response regulator CckA